MPLSPHKLDINLWANYLQTNWSISTNYVTILDKYNNPVSWNFYDLKMEVSDNNLVFVDNWKDNFSTSTYEWYKIFRLRSLNKLWESNLKVSLYDLDGNVEYFIGHITDCTEQIEHLDIIKKNKLELEKNKNEIIKSRQMWIDAIERNGDGLWEWNLSDNSVFFSTQWKRMLGFEEDEIQNSLIEWEKRVHPDDLAKAFQDIKNYLNGKTLQYNSEYRLLCRDGNYKWILDRGAVSKFDENNKPLIMVGTHRDITNIKEEENKLKLILKNIPDLVWIKDINGKFVACNKRFEDFVGQTEEKLIDYRLWLCI